MVVMTTRVPKFTLTAAATFAMVCAMAAPASAQWLNYPKKSTAHLPNGQVNMTAPAPKQADGKPDLSGVWLGDNWGPKGARPNQGNRNTITGKLTPSAQKDFDHRVETHLLDDPKVRCMPNG